MTINRFKTLEEQTHILQGVASAFPPESPQYTAIKNATFALIFAMSEEYESFICFVNSNREELTNKQKLNLRKFGIDL